LSLSEGKRLTAAVQTEIVRAQAAAMGERFRCCAHCRSALSIKVAIANHVLNRMNDLGRPKSVRVS
jgi:hypothetical protein